MNSFYGYYKPSLIISSVLNHVWEKGREVKVLMEQGKISGRQTVYLLIALVASTALIFLPAITARDAGRDAWLAPVLSTVPGIYVALIITALGKRFSGQTLIQYLQVVLGTWPGKVVGLSYLLFFLHTNSVVLREFGEGMALIMVRTPIVVFMVLMLLLCAWVVRGGLEVLARVVELTYPVVILVFVVMVILAALDMDFSNLLPVLENGLKPVIKASVAPGAWRGEIILLAMFLPYLARPGEGRRSAVLAVLILGLILTFDAIASTAALGPEVSRLTFPTLSLIRDVTVSFLERIDPLVLAIWIIGIFGKIGLFYYATVLGAAQLVNLKNYQPLVFPVGVLTMALAVQSAENFTHLTVYLAGIWPLLAIIFEYIIPTVLLVAAAIRGSYAAGE